MQFISPFNPEYTFSFIPTLCLLSNCDQEIRSLAIFSIIQRLLHFILYFLNFYSLFLHWPTPKNVTELRELNKRCILYRKFVKGFGSIMTHLTDLPTKINLNQWTLQRDYLFIYAKCNTQAGICQILVSK